MALTGINIAADLGISTLFCTQNINVNGVLSNATGVNAFDTSVYVGTMAVLVQGGNGATNTAGYIYLASSADNNSSNATNLGAGYNTANFTNVNSQLFVIPVDTRATKRYLYAFSLISGTGANFGADGTVVGIKKYT